MTFRPGPLRAAAILAAAFIAGRVVYRVLFHGADGDGVVLLDLPEVRLPPPFAHVVLLGPVTGDGLWDAAASALPIALAILAFGVVNAVFDLPLYKGKPPRLFMGAHFPRMLRMCGRLADGWLPGQKVDGAEYAARLALIREAAAKAGRPTNGFVAGQTLLVAFGKHRDQVLEKALRN